MMHATLTFGLLLLAAHPAVPVRKIDWKFVF